MWHVFQKICLVYPKNRKERNEIGKLEWNVICEREKIYSLFIDHRCPNWIEDIEKYLQFVEVFSYLFYWGSNLNTIGFCQRCGDTLPLKRKWKIYVGFDLTVSFVKMQMRPRFLLFLTLLFLTLFSSVFFCWSIKWLEKKIF